MNQGALPLFADDTDWTTYSELADELEAEYAAAGPALVRSVLAALDVYENDATRPQRESALQQLNTCSLELSCLNAIWNEFSNAVFEVVVIPAKTTTTGVASHLREVLAKTITELEKAKK